MRYEKLPKELLMTVCRDEDVEKIVGIIVSAGRTGNIGDGKIFVLDISDAIAIRTGQRGEECL